MTIYDRNVDEDVSAKRCLACDFWAMARRQKARDSWLTMYVYTDRPSSELVVDYEDIAFCPVCGRRI